MMMVMLVMMMEFENRRAGTPIYDDVKIITGEKVMMIRMMGDSENDHGGDDGTAFGTLNSQ